jgi:hypothetical protein
LSSTPTGSAVLADKAALLIDQRLMSTYGTLLSAGLGTVGDVLLQGTLDAVLPRVDVLALQL